MSNKFNAKHMNKLDNPQRRKVLPPDKVIDLLEMKPGQEVADVGCGIGYFSIPMSKVVGESGKVYAIDISPNMLEEVKLRVEREKINNIETIQSLENDFKIRDKSVDMVFTSTVFHEIDSTNSFLKECNRVLKDQGCLVILDWNKVNEDYGPPIHKRKDIKEVIEAIENNKFSLNKEEYLGNSFYIVVAKKIL